MNPILDRIVAVMGLVGGTAGLGAAWLTGDRALVWPSVVTLLLTALVLAYSRQARDESDRPRWGTRRRRIACYTVTVLFSGVVAVWLALAHEWRIEAPCTPLMLFVVLWLGFIALGFAGRLLNEVRDGADA